MGAAQSQEEARVTLEKDAFNFVNVSEDVVNKLLTEGGGQSPLSTSQGGNNPPPSSGGSNGSTATASDPELANIRTALNDERLLTMRLKNDLNQIYKEKDAIASKLASLMADQGVEAKSASSFAKQDEYYRRMKELTAQQRELQDAMKKQFKDTVDSVSAKFFAKPPPTVCADLETRVLKCYMDNPRQTLLCADIANEFIKCVEEHKRQVLSRQG